MKFSFKMLSIAATTAVAFALLILESERTSRLVRGHLEDIQEKYLPLVKAGPELASDLEHLRRGFQDAIAARDLEALDSAKSIRDELILHLDSARRAMDEAEVARLRSAVEEYYQVGFSISRRLIAGATPEDAIEDTRRMQLLYNEAEAQLKKTAGFDPQELTEAFDTLRRVQRAGGETRLLINVIAFVIVFAMVLLISRGALRTINALYEGLARFGRGELDRPVEVLSNDELGEVAKRANEMAASIRRANEARDAVDWQKAGLAKLASAMQNELDSRASGALALGVLARHTGAAAAALYTENRDGAFELLADYALSGQASAAPRFRRGEGVVGEAAQRTELAFIDEPPKDYLRVRSGLGEAPPRSIILVPVVHLGRVIGVVEVALLKPRTPAIEEFLLASRDALAIGLDLAETRRAQKALLHETQNQAEELRAQEEELRLNNDELQRQQEELRTTNEELVHQADELETQQHALRDRNNELEEARKSLQEKARELEQVSHYKSQFLSNMSHELRTPLNSMLLLSSMLGENEEKNLTERQVEYANTILSAGRDLLALINQVLDLAKIEAGKQTILIEPVIVAELISHAARVHGPVAKNKKLAFTTELAPGTPEKIFSDKRRVEQVLTNLLGNAIKFTEHGDVSLKIGPVAGEKKISIEVSDTGIGIAAEDQKRIFAPFEQVDGKTERKYGGTGLGLAIVRELTNLLGGELQLSSAPGQGTTFKVILPHRTVAADEDQSSTLPSREQKTAPDVHTPQALPPTGPDQQRGTLLLIEDDLVFADRVAEIASASGLHVVVAKDGESGLALAQTHRPRGIMLDVRLPDIDGLEVMNRLRNNPLTANIPVHFMSALDIREKGLSLGAVGYLTKPITKEDLTSALETLMPRASTARALILEGTKEFGDSVVGLLKQADIEARRVSSGPSAIAALQTHSYACLILDLALPDTDALALLEQLHREQKSMPPVIVYTDRALSREEVQKLEAYTESVVLREGRSSERLLDEARLFVNRVKSGAAPSPKPAAASSGSRSINFGGQKVLVADDDMRTVYALSALLKAKGAEVLVADNGKAAIETLSGNPDIRAVLMDIMMPEMDGYEAMRRIRAIERHRNLPIIALTAKAMKGDRAKCLEAGASDYMSKPIDGDRILAMLHTWLSGAAPAPGGSVS